MKHTKALRKAIITLMHCKTEAAAKKCAERIDTLIDAAEQEYRNLQLIIALYETVLEKQE